MIMQGVRTTFLSHCWHNPTFSVLTNPYFNPLVHHAPSVLTTPLSVRSCYNSPSACFIPSSEIQRPPHASQTDSILPILFPTV
jgi:hypothetical protein